MGRLRPSAWAAIDCGSAGLRWAVRRGELADVSRPGRVMSVTRGRVIDTVAIADELTRLIGRRRVGPVAVSVPVHATATDISAVTAAIVGGLRASEVLAVPASRASAASINVTSAVVVDIGAQLLEVSRVEDGEVVQQGVLEWGVNDLLRSLNRVIEETMRVRLDSRALATAVVGTVATGRDMDSQAIRVVRVEPRHIDAAAGQALAWAEDQIARQRTGPIPVVAVGGGMRLPFLRMRAHEWGGRVVMPDEPRLATVRGLAALLEEHRP